MKIRVINPIIFLAIMFFAKLSVAQNTASSLNIRPISIALAPQIKCENFLPDDSAKAIEYAQRFHRFYTRAFDSLSQANPDFVLLKKKRESADLQLTFQMSFVPKKGQGFRDFYGELKLAFRVTHQVSKKDMLKMSLSSQRFVGFYEKYYKSVANFTIQKFLYSFTSNFVPFASLLHPEKRKAPTQVMLQSFTVKNKKLKPVALNFNHLANNTLALYQNKKMPAKEREDATFMFNFKYLPQYRLQKQVILPSDEQPVIISGQLVAKNKTHYELQLKFTGKPISMKFYSTPIKTSLLFRKELIDAGNYTEANYKITENFLLVIFSNYQ